MLDNVAWLPPVTKDHAPGLADRLSAIHAQMKRKYPQISRIAVAVYDDKTEVVRTFIDSTDAGMENPFEFYEMPLSESPSLAETARTRRSRVINDLPSMAKSGSRRTVRIINAGCRSSYTRPLYSGRQLLGFLFFDSRDTGFFSPAVIAELDSYALTIAATVSVEILRFGTLRGALETLRNMSHYRDEESGNHLERMSSYAALIGKSLAPTHGLSEEYVEFLYRFAALHDVGKIAIADGILLKPGKLSPDEFAIMTGHTDRGGEIVRDIVKAFRLDDLPHIGMLDNIVRHHHEAVDGSGYPAGLAGDDIPLEARIVCVADIFDALASPRPHKTAWPNEKIFDYLRQESGRRVDVAVVDALLSQAPEIERIQGIYPDDPREVRWAAST